MNAIIIHGTCSRDEYFNDAFPSLSNSHWFPWLQKQLLMKGLLTQTPEMPEAYKPDYERWEKEFEKHDITPDTIFIGHSCGAGFLMRWLSENKKQIYKLILVAPWMDPSKKKTKEFFNFTIDAKIADRVKEIHMLLSTNEETEGVKETVDMIENTLPSVHMHRFKDKGHFTFADMQTTSFPELLKIIF